MGSVSMAMIVLGVPHVICPRCLEPLCTCKHTDNIVDFESYRILNSKSVYAATNTICNNCGLPFTDHTGERCPKS